VSEEGLRDTRPVNRREQHEAALQAAIEKASASAALLVAIQSALQANCRNRFFAVNASAMSLPSGLSEICFRESNRAVLKVSQWFSDEKILQRGLGVLQGM